MIAAVAVYTLAASRLRHDRLIQGTLAVVVAGVIVARILMATAFAGTLGLLLGLFVFFDVFGAQTMIVFWALAGDLFNPRVRPENLTLVVIALAANIADYQLDLALEASYGADGQGMVRFLALFRLVAGIGSSSGSRE